MSSTITQDKLKTALDRLAPWHPRATDWRKLSNGRIVRFVDWRRIASRRRT